jgi:hypothetical protein
MLEAEFRAFPILTLDISGQTHAPAVLAEEKNPSVPFL